MNAKKFSVALGNVRDDYVSEAIAYQNKRKSKSWLKWAAMAACLCLVIIGTFVAPGLQGESGGVDPQLSGTPGTNIIQSGSDNEITQPGKTNLLVVNEVEGVMSADMDVQFSHYNDLSAVEREIILKEFETTIGLGYDDFTAKISDTFVSRSFYSVDVPTDATRTEYIPHDYVFEYQTENGGETRIAICSAGEPLRDCFIKCDNPKQSEINGVAVVIYGYRDTFMVQFSHENISYDIETSNITFEELEVLLTGIME